MYSLTAARLGWWVCALSLLVWAIQLSLWAVGGFEIPQPAGDVQQIWSGRFLRVAYALAIGATSVIGAVVIAHHPRNPIGWLSSIGGLMVALDILAGVYATSPVLAQPSARPPAAAAIAWLGNVLEANWALIAPILILFPDGRLPSARWRPLLWLGAGAGVVLVLSLAVMPGPLSSVKSIENPLGLVGYAEPVAQLGQLARFAVAAAIVLSAAALVVRFRRARGDERQQLKWIVSAASMWALTLVALVLSPPAWQPVARIVYVVV